MKRKLIYEKPSEMSREEIEAEFATDDPNRIANALVASFYSEEPELVESWCYRFAVHPSEVSRRTAAVVLGNMAAVHGLRDVNRALTVLRKLCEQPAIKAEAEDSLEDILHAERRKPQ